MSSRSILALRLDTTSDEKLGMLVLESENEDKFTARNGAELRRSTVYRAMVDILAASHTQLPRVLERAQERAGAKNAERLLEEPVWKNSTHRT